MKEGKVWSTLYDRIVVIIVTIPEFLKPGDYAQKENVYKK